GTALAAQERGERDLRKVVCLGGADLRVGGNQLLLGFADIGAAFEQRGRQPGGQLGWQALVVHWLAARDIAGRPAQQQAERVLRLTDVTLGAGDLRGSDEEKLFRLMNVQPGGGSVIVAQAHRSEEHTSELQSLTNLVCR